MLAPDPEQLRAAVQEALENHNLEEKIDCPTREQQPQTPDFQQIADSIYKDPVNASLDVANNYAVTPSATGLSLDASQAQAAYDAAAEGTDVTVPLTITQPSITTEALNANLFKDVLGTYQSSVTGDSGEKDQYQSGCEYVQRHYSSAGGNLFLQRDHRGDIPGAGLPDGERLSGRRSSPGARRRSLPGVLHHILCSAVYGSGSGAASRIIP